MFLPMEVVCLKMDMSQARLLNPLCEMSFGSLAWMRPARFSRVPIQVSAKLCDIDAKRLLPRCPSAWLRGALYTRGQIFFSVWAFRCCSVYRGWCYQCYIRQSL